MGKGVNLFPLDSSGSTIPHSSCTQFFAAAQSMCRRVTRRRASSVSRTKVGIVSKTHFKIRALSFHFLSQRTCRTFSQKISCPLEGPPFLHELGDVGMDDAVPLLNGVASRQ